jgi:hypothetical protein
LAFDAKKSQPEGFTWHVMPYEENLTDDLACDALCKDDLKALPGM